MAHNDQYSQDGQDMDTVEYGYGTPPPGSNCAPPVQIRPTVQTTIQFPTNVARLLNRPPPTVQQQAVATPVDENGDYDARKFVSVASARLKLCIQRSKLVYDNACDGRFGRETFIDLTDPKIEFIPDYFIGTEFPIILEAIMREITDQENVRSVVGLVDRIKDAVVVRMNQSMGVYSGSKGLRYYLARWDKETRRNTFVCMNERGFKDWLSSYNITVPCKKKKNGDIVELISLYEVFNKHPNKRQFLSTTFDPRWNYEVSS